MKVEFQVVDQAQWDTCEKVVPVIKAIRSLTGLGLREAKSVTDGFNDGESFKGKMINHDNSLIGELKANGINVDSVTQRYINDTRALLIKSVNDGEFVLAQNYLSALHEITSNYPLVT